jgi:hypothetical protein
MFEWDLSEVIYALVAGYIVVRVVESLLRCNAQVAECGGLIKGVSILTGMSAAAFRLFMESRFQLPDLMAEETLADSLPAIFDALAFGAVVGVAAYPLGAFASFVWVYAIRPIVNVIVATLHLPLGMTRAIRSANRRRDAARTTEQSRLADEERRDNDERQALARRALELVAQQTRDQARLACELEYSRFCPSIQSRFPRTDLDDFLVRYMNDKLAASDVEARSVQLLALIRLHADQSGQGTKHPTIDELAAWFVAEKAKIASLPLEDKLKYYHLAELNERYSDLTSEIMRRAAP